MEERLDNMFSENKKQTKKEVTEKKENKEGAEGAETKDGAEKKDVAESASAPGEAKELQNLLKAWGAQS